MNKLTDVTSIMISIFAVGVLLAGLILNGQSEIKRELGADITGVNGEITGIKEDIADLQQNMARKQDVTDLQQRTARIEGQLALLIEAWNVEKPPVPGVADG